MIVYLISAGCYSDYDVYSVSFDRADAEKQAERLAAIIHDEVNIEERDTDLMKNLMDGKTKVFTFCFDIDTRWIKWELTQSMIPDSDQNRYLMYNCTQRKCTGNTWYNEKFNQFNTKVFANDYDTAVKVAHDRFAQFIAQREGIC